MSAHGTVKVVASGVAGDTTLPKLELLDSELDLVQQASFGEEVELPAGRYVVSAAFPSGERYSKAVDVAAGTTAEVSLGREARATSAAVPAPPAPAQTTWFRRFLREDAGAWQVARADVEVDDVLRDGTSLQVIMIVYPREPAITFMQLALPDEVPLSVALPAVAGDGPGSCRVNLTFGGGPSRVRVHFSGGGSVESVRGYMDSGHLTEAAELARDAEQLLMAKGADPIAAALGGYTLLRLRLVDRLHDWPENLAAWYPWLPDGAIIAGERAALDGDHDRACRHFAEANRRGLPVFVDGFSTLVSRLRGYGRTEELPGGLTVAARDAAVAGLPRLMRMAPLVDHTRVVLAFRAADLANPAESQYDLEAVSAARGWRRFRLPAGTPDDPRAWWSDP